MANLFKAIQLLRSVEWFKKSVSDIWEGKVEDWSDFTDIVKDI